MKALRIIVTILFLFPLTLTAQQLDADESKRALTQTWYSYKVGDPVQGEMFDTKNHERLTLNEDGTGQIMVMHSKMGEMVVDFGWQFNEADYTLEMTLEMNGQTEAETLNIDNLSNEELVLVQGDRKVTQYLTKVSEPFLNLKQVVSDNPNNSLDMNAWEGKYVFSEAAVFVGDDKQETLSGAGEIVLHEKDGEKHITITHDGKSETYPVSQGQFNINGNRHFIFVTDDTNLAGGLMVMNDGSLFTYRDKDENESRIEYTLAE